MAWMTRGQVRSQPVQSYAEKALQKMLADMDGRMNRLNGEYLRRMGEHIRDIGTLWPSDVHRLQQLRRMNRNLRQIEQRIARAAGRTEAEIEGVFLRVAEEDARMATRILGVPDIRNVKDNLPLQRILRAQARETADRMRNLSNTTVVSSFYRGAIDEACTAVQSGVEDYNTAIRRVIREAGQHGLRITEGGSREVDYESGRSRRLDSAVRMNVLDGVRHLNQSIMEEVGRQFGANGVEIDAHMLCAEDHLPYQGQQFSNEEFEDIQDSLDRPFGEWNCRHSWHGIILGVSPPTYTPDQLEKMQRYSTERITVDGRTKTRYQWSQEMRRCETAVRQQKDAANLARTTGDDALRRHCQGIILELNKYYEQLADKVGIGPEFQRTYVPGFKDTDIGKELQEAASRAIMNVATGGHRNEKPLTPEQISDAVEYAVSLGMPRENIRYSDNGETSYISFQGMVDILRIGTDVLPNPQGKTANELITCHGAIAHEVVGHRATCLRHTNGEARSVYDEVQASVRAAKFAKGLTDYERELLMNDARARVASIGADFDKYIKPMDVWER